MEVSIVVRITATVKRDEDGEVMDREELRDGLLGEVETVCDDIDMIDDYAVENVSVQDVTPKKGR